jgi:hypothetical protein
LLNRYGANPGDFLQDDALSTGMMNHTLLFIGSMIARPDAQQQYSGKKIDL